jgi:hypothetical protein
VKKFITSVQHLQAFSNLILEATWTLSSLSLKNSQRIDDTFNAFLNLILIEIEKSKFDLHDCIGNSLSSIIALKDGKGLLDMRDAFISFVAFDVAECKVVVAL